MNFAKEIRARVDCKEVFSAYGYPPNRAGFVLCPFHREKTPSLKIFEGDKGWACFGCSSHGDVIDFVERLFGLSFLDAQKKINSDFGLNLPIEKKIGFREQLEVAKKQYERKKRIEQWKNRLLALEEEYLKAEAELIKLEDWKKRFSPKSVNEEFHPLFVEALQNIVFVEHALQTAETRLRAHEQQRTY